MPFFAHIQQPPLPLNPIADKNAALIWRHPPHKRGASLLLLLFFLIINIIRRLHTKWIHLQLWRKKEEEVVASTLRHRVLAVRKDGEAEWENSQFFRSYRVHNVAFGASMEFATLEEI